MSERIVDNPANHGWVEENGKWVWEGGATTGHIEDGTIQGQITTWDVAKTEWTPDGSLTIDASGNATFGGEVYTYVCKGKDRSGLRFQTPNIIPVNPDGSNANGAIDLGTASAKWKDGYFTGTVNTGVVAAGQMSTSRPTNGTFFTMNQGSNSSRLAHEGGGALTLYPLGGVFNVSGDATITGTVDAAEFTVNGQPFNATFDLGDLPAPAGSVASAELMKLDNANRQYIDLKVIRNSGGDWTGTETRMQMRIDVTPQGFVGFANWRVNLGIGDDVLAYLDQSGNLTATDFIATSDERLKKNITTAPLGAIDKIRGVEFDWKVGGERASGVIAQEVEAVPALSHLVRNSGDEDQTRVVSYLGLIPYLIEEVKALKAEVQALKDAV